MRKSIGIIIGLLCLLGGLSLFLNVFFQIAFPIFSLLFALAFLYLGGILLFEVLKIKVPGFNLKHETVVLQQREVSATSAQVQDHGVHIFLGHGILDVAHVIPRPYHNEINLKVLLGESTIRFDPNLPLRINVSCVLADCLMPNGNNVTFGRLNYNTPAAAEQATATPLSAEQADAQFDKPPLVLNIIAVLGIVRFESYVGSSTPPESSGLKSDHLRA